ncbi:MAG: PD-(D/E)XK nuclease family protein, partial [Eubacterium sp.]|nr:PD-(D/E)XK nuclease family protein [Eubacterium sp.]
MALQFITGASGSGKSTYIYSHICREAKEHPEKNYIILVPDQFTLETQKTLVEMSGCGGILNIDVLSFQRLAYRVLEIFPTYRKPILEDMGKTMILRKVFAEQMQNLQYFKRGLNKPGFLDECKSFFCELMQYSIDENDFHEMREALGKGSLMDLKMQDLQLVYKEFLKKMSDTYMMAEELIPQLTMLVPKVNFLQGATVCLDGFTGFTPTQYELLEALLKHSEQMYITVTTDRTGMRKDIFSMSDELMRKMSKMAAECPVSILPPVETGREGTLAPYRQAEESELAFLEKNIFSYRGEQWKEKPEQIAVRVCKKQQDEAAYVARTIRSLTRKEGYRYDEIAVVVSRIDHYEQALTKEMERLGIRYFLDYKKSIGANELAEYILAFLDMYRRGMDYESTMRYLKCGLAPLSTEETDVLDNYIFAKGRRGYRSYCSEWKYELRDVDLMDVNEYREKLVDAIGDAFEALRGGKKTVREFTTIVYRHLVHNEIYQKIQRHAEWFEEMGNALLAKESRRIYRIVMAFFDELVQLLGDEEVTFAEYQELVGAGISEGLVGFVPPEKNQVKIGDIERSRLKDIKVLFFVGITDDVIPKGNVAPGILSETERKIIEEKGIELAPQGERAALSERFYLYLTMTKPAEKLYVTYSKLSSGGEGKRPAYLISSLKKVFPLLEIWDEELNEPELSAKIGSDQGKTYLLRQLMSGEYKEDAVWKEIAAFHGKHNPKWWSALLCRLSEQEKETQLSEEAIRYLYGDKIIGSVTRMETYAKCPFQYFVRYGLGIMPREEYTVQSFDRGNVLHRAMEHISHRMEKEGKTWDTLTPADLRDYAKESVDYVVEQYNDGVFFQSEREKYTITRIKHVLEKSLEIQWEQMKKGEFKQLYSEKHFPGEESLDSVVFELENGRYMTLQGVIDRVDICQLPDKDLIKIIDYKNYQSTLQLDHIYYGLQMQLVTYLSAALEMQKKSNAGKDVVPASMLYYEMKRTDLEWKKENEEGRRKRQMGSFRCEGYSNLDVDVLQALDRDLVCDDEFVPGATSDVVKVRIQRNGSFYNSAQLLTQREFELLMTHVRRKLEQYANEIFHGESNARPYRLGDKTGCDYCQMQG